MELDERKLRILQAIIDDYILTATPVGSRTIAKHQGINLSSATIRNEMSDLEELGFLEQPHTSAGRIPSDKAYRLYVNNLIAHAPLNEKEQAAIQAYFTRRLDEVEDVVKQTAWVLSNVTRYTSMVLAPQLTAARIKHIQLVPVAEGKALAVIVTDAGITRDSIIRVPQDMSAHQLEQLSHMLTKTFANVKIDQVKSAAQELMNEQLGLHAELLESIFRSISARDEKRGVELSGATNMLNYPEYYDLDKAKNFLAAIESKDYFYDLLAQASKLELTITIGNENSNRELKDVSVVTATYKIGDQPLGSMGVIGPTRMNYGRVLSILRFVGQSMSEMLTNLIEED